MDAGAAARGRPPVPRSGRGDVFRRSGGSPLKTNRCPIQYCQMSPRVHRLDTSEVLPPVVGQRCPIHDLAVGRDGRCVRCRQQDERTAAAKRSRWPGWTVIISVLVTVGGLGYLFFGPRPAKKKAAGPAPAAAAVVKPDSRLLWEQLGSDDPTGDPGASSPGDKRPSVASAPTTSDDPTKPKSPIYVAPPPAFTPEYLDLVRDGARKLDIQMYYATWCAVCTRARNWLSKNRIPYTAHDLERDEGAKKQLLRLNPRRSIPTFKVGNRVLEGYSSSVFCRTVLSEVNKK